MKRIFTVAAATILATLSACADTPTSAVPSATASAGVLPQPTITPAPVSPSASPADAGVGLRGTAEYSLSNDDGYRGRAVIQVDQPVRLAGSPDEAEVSNCILGKIAPRTTAVVVLRFGFVDLSDPSLPWSLSWGISGVEVLATRDGLGEPIKCRQSAVWSGTGTIAIILALPNYYTPNKPKGNPGMLKNVRVSFPLVGGLITAKPTSSTGPLEATTSGIISASTLEIRLGR